jgi:hypothetical protein
VPTLTLRAAITTAMPLNTTAVSATDNCIWEFSPTVCGEGVSYQELVYPRKKTCMPLPTPMKNVWTNECSSWFGESHCLPPRHLSFHDDKQVVHGTTRGIGADSRGYRSLHYVDSA